MGPAPPRRTPALRWWREVLYVLAFYGLYSAVRNTQGSAAVSAATAFRHARRVIHLERVIGLYHERAVQDAFLGAHGFIRFWNIYYGTFHFFVTIGVLVWLFRRFPDRYPRWRNTLAATTGLALVGFALFPLMPPRLLPASYGYVDTLARIGGLWSFQSGAMQAVSNQYAAMPSLHFAWASWCTLALYPTLRNTRARLLAVAYPAATLFAVVVTANHYVLDAVGGAVTLAAGYAIGAAVTRAVARARPAGERAEVAAPA